ncbi:NAD-dependent epimerase/dehydratase family protein [Vineibacter terrae]|uniref:NAD-dependent epimerase/dehydratase family protein n=1 Tax=Vineibacter terrae TaxID=2586908 RepID=A0A5C8PKF9_9HYPH|nr:NAD-dependent epimerase/dehydratase family protein [Vineibacter terrae]TXL74155.1 NAD-dependent epimerase/dehydratase family protein [Vineibacter terrae]
MSALVAVTGATGFIGQHLIAMLAANGVRQRLLVRRLPALPATSSPEAIELVVGDLGDKAALRRLVDGADVVIHLAGAIKAVHRADFFRFNAQAVHDLLAAAAAVGGTARVILVSSLAARAPGLSDYAASKRAGEDCLVAAAPAPGWLAVRAPAVYGPGDRETLAFFRCVKRGLAPVPGAGRGRLSLIHVGDLCRVLLAAVSRPTQSGVYEIDDGTAAGYSLADMAGAAAGVLGSRPRTIGVPRALMTGVAGVQQMVARLTGRPAILSLGKVREIFHDDWVVTDRRLMQALGIVPNFDLRLGFEDTILWYLRHRWL